MQIAPARYFARLSQARATMAADRARLRASLQNASPALNRWSMASRIQACVRRVSIICTTVQASTIAARMSERAAP